MLKLLLISPHFAPTNAPDMQRIRLLLPHLAKQGAEATVLAVSPEHSDFPEDDWLSSSLTSSQKIHRVGALGDSWRRFPGFGSLSSRSFDSLRKKGNELLRNGPYDLVYFSTTQFGIHLLGPYWKSKFGIPFAMDFQDPWVNNYYREHPAVIPPGGRLKFAAADCFNRFAEPRVIRECSGITSVSEAYPKMLQSRYPDLIFREWIPNSPPESRVLPILTAPFPFESENPEASTPGVSQQSIFDPNDGRKHWFYAGRCNEPMETSLRSLFDTFRRLQASRPSFFDSVRIHFVGTLYHSNSSSSSPIGKLVRHYGLEDTVCEHPDRIPYSEVIQCLEDADLLFVPGSDDPGYSASKIFPYLFSTTPALLVFHEESPVIRITEEAGGGVAIPFSTHETPPEISQRIHRAFDGTSESINVPPNLLGLEKYSAASQAETLLQFLDHCRESHHAAEEEVALTS